MFIPHLSFPGSQFLFALGEINFSEFQGEVVVVQRQVGARNLLALKGLRARGYKIVFDLDDDLTCLPQGNPMKKVWESVVDGVAPCIAQASIITVSTRGLAGAIERLYGYLQKPIIVCPNTIDLRLYRDTTVARADDNIVVGWAGTNTHWEDVKESWGVLPDVLKSNQHVRMEFVGQPPPREIIGHGRVRTRPWSAVGEFPGRFASWGWDVALAPLTDVRFNKSKSAIKFLEAAAQKIPTLCSDVQPYREVCSLGGEDLKWLLCSFPSQWKSKLNRLVNEPDWRRHLGELAYSVTDRFFNIQTGVHAWKRAAQIAMEQV